MGSLSRSFRKTLVSNGLSAPRNAEELSFAPAVVTGLRTDRVKENHGPGALGVFFAPVLFLDAMGAFDEYVDVHHFYEARRNDNNLWDIAYKTRRAGGGRIIDEQKIATGLTFFAMLGQMQGCAQYLALPVRLVTHRDGKKELYPDTDIKILDVTLPKTITLDRALALMPDAPVADFSSVPDYERRADYAHREAERSAFYEYRRSLTPEQKEAAERKGEKLREDIIQDAEKNDRYAAIWIDNLELCWRSETGRDLKVYIRESNTALAQRLVREYREQNPKPEI